MADNWNFDLHANSYKRRRQLVYQTPVPVDMKREELQNRNQTFQCL